MPRKILLADDSVTAQNMGRRILTEAGYEVITVNNGAAAIKKIAEIRPDLVVLDVHMPGYSGLEVCQRLRETPKLARIPVLLTVGKLEPFRADDARRVRADAYVIKPFEATELLAVLTRLEDKIVPGGSELEDEDQGWRNRLRIPAPYMKREESPAEPASEAAAAEPVAPQTQEATPRAEEVASPTAGTAAETDKVVSIDKAAEAASVPQEAASEEASAVPVAMASQPAEEHIVSAEPVQANAAPTEQEPVSTSFGRGAESQSVTFAPITEVAAEGEVASVAVPETGHADEVAAALASLVPAGAVVDQSTDEQPAEKVEEYAAATTAEDTGTYAGPRWIAAEVSASEEESALVLELEMQRAYAAFAAADAARLANYSPTTAISAPPELVASEPEFQVQTAEQPKETDYDAEVAAKVAAYIDTEEDLIYSEIAAAAASKTANAVQPLPDMAGAVAEPGPEEKAAYAVASAGATVVSSGTAEVQAPVETPPAPEPVAVPQDAELATAWEHWKHIRESVGSAEFSAQIAESAAAVVQQNHSEPQPEPNQAEVSAETGDESAEIASIVDSVLTDLKPKLMEEIAKKMGKGKKK